MGGEAILALTILILAWPVTILANDDCADAIEIILPLGGGSVTESGSTVGATFDDVGFCGTSNTTAGVWYKVTHDGGLIASTCNAANYDTKISIFKDGCGTLTCVGGLDDTAGCGGFTTELGVPADGSEYLILVHGFASQTGDFDLTVTGVEAQGNDDAVDAMPLALGETPFDNAFATVEPDEPSPGAGTGASSCNSQDGWCAFETDVDNSLWYSFQAPPLGCVSIAADGFDTQLALWDVEDPADFSTFVEVAANDDSADLVIGGSHVFAAGISEACVNPNQTYYVQLDGFNGQDGPGTLTLRADVCDCDADGVLDDQDACLGSDFSDTVVIDECDSGIENAFFEDGCTIVDLVGKCDDPKNHGDFVSCVSHTTNALKKDQLLFGDEKGAIQRCAAQADIP
jgi:hypothetical protein